MDELYKILNNLELEKPSEDCPQYEFIDVFKNPRKWPINQIFLERTTLELRRDANLDVSERSEDLLQKSYEEKEEILPALHKSWVPQGQIYYHFFPYNFTEEDNSAFTRKNRLFLETLNYLLACNYHQFWCLVLFEPEIGVSLHSFLLHPIQPFQFENMETPQLDVYLAVFSQFLKVYQRLLRFQDSPLEYMPQENVLEYLLDKKYLTLPIVITLNLLYGDVEPHFINDLTAIYLEQPTNRKFVAKEIDEMLGHMLMVLDMVGGHVCGFEKGAVVVPIAVEPRPKIFDLGWVYDIVDYLLNMVSALGVLLKNGKDSKALALEKGMPYRLAFTYEKVFFSLYDMLWERPEVDENPRLARIIFDQIAIARSTFIECFNCFVTHTLDKVLEYSGNPVKQEEFVEVYLKLLTSALEDEYFICDYNETYDVKQQNEMFGSCAEIDPTRTDYLISCISSFRRHNRIWKTLHTNSSTFRKALLKYSNRKKVVSGFWDDEPIIQPITRQQAVTGVNCTEEEIEEMIRMVIDMFPHLGDGFVLKCLEAYNYQTSEVISAILEQNLPPHISDIPFDQIRIPPEPEPQQPKEAWIKKKPGYRDTLELLNDKRDMKQIKTFITEGLAYSNELYDDEYDDRDEEEATVAVADHGSEDVLKYNPNYEEVVSDTSYSDNEFDDKGAVVTPRDPRNFCEDPAVIRARREARRNPGGSKNPQQPGKSRDVVGKPKGQGQEKGVLNSRNKKTVNKSSRANHNRKSGAQFKRNKGMVPS